MPQTNYEKLIERQLQEKTGDPKLTIAQFLLQAANDRTPEKDAAAFLGIPLGTYRDWRRRHVVRVARYLRVDTDHGNQILLPDMPEPVEA